MRPANCQKGGPMNLSGLAKPMNCQKPARVNLTAGRCEGSGPFGRPHGTLFGDTSFDPSLICERYRVLKRIPTPPYRDRRGSQGALFGNPGPFQDQNNNVGQTPRCGTKRYVRSWGRTPKTGWRFRLRITLRIRTTFPGRTAATSTQPKPSQRSATHAGPGRLSRGPAKAREVQAALTRHGHDHVRGHDQAAQRHPVATVSAPEARARHVSPT